MEGIFGRRLVDLFCGPFGLIGNRVLNGISSSSSSSSVKFRPSRSMRSRGSWLASVYQEYNSRGGGGKQFVVVLRWLS